jgi:small-conductance mechanosensitive channel
VLTLYEQTTAGRATYLGDARLAAFPASERRMLSYAVDAKVTVDRSSEEQHAIVKAAIAQGVMRLTRLARQITTYRMKTASDGEHRLLIEHPRLAGWSLATPNPAHVELSADAYRIPATLTGNQQSNIAVAMERPLEETIRLLDLADDRLGVLVTSNELEPPVRKALGELASRRQSLGRQNAELDKLKEQRRQLIEDEKRLRDNLAAIGRDTALYKQTLDKLGETEATITALSTAIEKAAAEVETAKEQLQAFVSALTL